MKAKKMIELVTSLDLNKQLKAAGFEVESKYIICEDESGKINIYDAQSPPDSIFCDYMKTILPTYLTDELLVEMPFCITVDHEKYKLVIKKPKITSVEVTQEHWVG